MIVKQFLAIAALVLILVGVPAVMIWSMVDHVRNSHHRQRRSGAAVGNALQELDRLVARPSVEHVVEAETNILRREDDQAGGDDEGGDDRKLAAPRSN